MPAPRPKLEFTASERKPGSATSTADCDAHATWPPAPSGGPTQTGSRGSSGALQPATATTRPRRSARNAPRGRRDGMKLAMPAEKPIRVAARCARVSGLTVLVFPRATPAMVRAHVPPGARMIAIDAGAEALRAVGVRPDALVGDMDSVSAQTLAEMREAAVALHEHPARKRDTDAALALRLVAPLDDVLFLGSGGGRADHALANLHLLASLDGRGRAIDEDALTWVAAPSRPLTLDRPEGAVVSMLPFDARVEGITYEGFEYALREATMTAGDPYGVSNVCLAPPQRVRVRAGRLLVIEPREAHRDGAM